MQKPGFAITTCLESRQRIFLHSGRDCGVPLLPFSLVTAPHILNWAYDHVAYIFQPWLHWFLWWYKQKFLLRLLERPLGGGSLTISGLPFRWQECRRHGWSSSSHTAPWGGGHMLMMAEKKDRKRTWISDDCLSGHTRSGFLLPDFVYMRNTFLSCLNTRYLGFLSFTAKQKSKRHSYQFPWHLS